MNDWTRQANIHLWRRFRNRAVPPGWNTPLSWQGYRRWMRFIVKEGYGRG